MIPQDDKDPKQRAAEVSARNKGYLYGPSLVGEAAPFPNGTLGQARVAADIALWSVDRNRMDAAITHDVQSVVNALVAVCEPLSLDTILHAYALFNFLERRLEDS